MREFFEKMNECLLFHRTSPHAVPPIRATPGSAGYDLSASESILVQPQGKWALVPTNLILEVPIGHYGRIAPRSGLALKHGIQVGGGVIDSDYRGEVGIILFNHGDKPFVVQPGDRIAQLILERISCPDAIEVNKMSMTHRGVGGFGSTGTK